MNTKQHKKGSSQNNWIDPLYLNDLLTDEEKRLNITGSSFIYRYNDNTNYFFKSFYGNITDCKTVSMRFDI